MPWYTRARGVLAAGTATVLSRATELWLRVGELLDAATARVLVRRAELTAALALTAVFVIAGGLSLRMALIGLVAAFAVAAVWPSEERGTGIGARTLGHAGADSDRLWRMVIDAVPEPAIALNSDGQHRPRQSPGRGAVRRAAARRPHRLHEPRPRSCWRPWRRRSHRASPAPSSCTARVPVERRLLATMVPLEHAPPAPAAPALLITFRDLTEQDRLARMRADFVANASHELRTPLASLKGYVETLQGSAKDDATARERFLKTMGEQAERMSRLVDDLLSLSRVEMREYLPPAGRGGPGRRPGRGGADPGAAGQHAPASPSTLSPATATAVVRGDHDELTQVFQNLIQNAIKYGRTGGKVEVRLRARAGGAGRRPASRRRDRRRARHRRRSTCRGSPSASTA